MSLEYFANLAEIIGVILVVASLIYVAKQLRQNTNAVRAQSRQSVLAASQAELFTTIEQPSLTLSIGSSDPLSQEEQVSVSSYLFAIFRAREFAWLQHNNGVIDDAQWNTELAVILFFIDGPRVRDWWANVGRGGFGDEFAAFIDVLCSENVPTNSSFTAMGAWVSLKEL
ncbi:MAG: hypothetical protein ACI9ON_003094 [Limisphaerales bacterium]|jgi:hypothetical protein